MTVCQIFPLTSLRTLAQLQHLQQQGASVLDAAPKKQDGSAKGLEYGDEGIADSRNNSGVGLHVMRANGGEHADEARQEPETEQLGLIGGSASASSHWLRW